MPDIIFEEIACKTALNRISAASERMMPFRWTLNPYRGCQHACTYCFARGSHQYLGYDAGRDFETRVVVKVNVPDVLRAELGRPGWRRELIAVGTACDPYQAAELKYSLTHRALKVLRDAANPASIVTKSPFIVRDADVLESLSQVAELTVNFSIATLDEDVWRRIEPGTARPTKRLEAMRLLAERGIRCGVLLAPVLPGITDDPADLERVVEAAREHGASFISDNVLYLKPGTREWFMPFLREAYPHLSERYARYYRGVYAPRSYTQEVHRAIERLRLKYDLVAPRAPQPSVGQLQLAM
ncbi:MAG TPA: radical SAM protein [Dehalococcoidia bacterium]|nr:radical SAM protein [Dehalococcoidia bacterium]